MKGQRSAVRTLALLGIGLTGIARGQIITEFPVPTAGSAPFGITAGPDAALWFTEGQGNKIGRSTIAGSITEFPITTAGSVPAGITLGPDGNLWFTEFTGNQIGRINTAGVITEFPIPTAASQPSGIAAGPDGNLWFTEQAGNQIGRITPAGVITEFPIDTANSQPSAIAAGPDGNLWFTERMGNQIGRITPAGTITEFPVLTAGSGPRGITLGPDGNLWFTQQTVNQIGRITPTGVVTEFPIPTASSQPIGIAAGADGNLWFVEAVGNKIGRITPAGTVTEFPIPTADSIPVSISPGPDTNVWFTEQVGNQIGRMTTGPATPIALEVDEHAMIGSVSNTNGVFEPDETVEVSPSWRSNLSIVAPLTGTASNFIGPPGTYTIVDATADYGSPDTAETVSCEVTEDCYLLAVSGARTQTHWDGTFDETLSGPGAAPRSWKLHIGASFADVPTSNIFYAFIENLFHNGVTGGCAFGYCPTNPVTRAQMAVFLLKARFGSAHVPPPCTGTVFTDVPCTTSPFDPWIEELAGLAITGGCGGGSYCPGATVTRKQMAVFLLKTLEGSTYNPPDCTIPVFADVPCTPGTGFSDWIEELYARGITGGCSASPLNYCPDNPNNRGQMAVFLVKTFGLLLYGPY